MDLIRDLAELALGSRLRRLSDRLLQDVSTIYDEQGKGLRARWFPVLFALSREAPQAVTDLARSLGLTHTAIHQIVVQMADQGLVITERDPADERRRLQSLSPHGKAAAKQLQPLWDEIASATEELLESAGLPLIPALAAVEEQLDRRSMYRRIRDRLDVEIFDFEPAHAQAFASLNRAWLEEHFEVEEEDRRLLDDPVGELIAGGGAVLCAVEAHEVVGVCGLKRDGEERMELTKMAVAPEHRGRGIGRRLVRAAVERARALGAHAVVAQCSPRLKPAVALYRSLGFRKLARRPAGLAEYQRPSILLELALETIAAGDTQ